MIKSSVKVHMSIPKTVKYKGKIYKLHDLRYFKDNESEEIEKSQRAGTMNGYDSVVAWVFADAPVNFGFTNPIYFIYYRKHTK